MNNVTIVSALFNIQREGMDGRNWEEYLEWFDITLKLKCPMVLFVTEDVREFIEERRLSIPTTVVVQTVEEIPYYYLKEKIDSIKSLVNLPVGVGFGINEPDVAKKVSSLADGVIVGSKIINEIEKYHTVSSEKCIDNIKNLISSFRLAIDN